LKKKGIFRETRYYLEYIAVRILHFLFNLVPEKCVYLVVGILGALAFRVFKIRRKVTIDNLNIAFGSKFSNKEIERIACESYKNIAITFVELFMAEKIKKNIFQRVDVSEFLQLIPKDGEHKGLILVGGHFGSWEMNGASVGMIGFPVTVVAKKQANPYVDDMIVKIRNGFGMKTIDHGTALKNLVQALKNRETIGLVSDQDAGKKGVFVDFFGRKASTPSGGAQLALKYGVPIIVLMTVRLSLGKYKTITRQVPVMEDDTIESLTQRYTSIMEDIIKEYPEQYFWMHRRWKTPYWKENA